jgi:hypothetical protein
MDRALNQPLYRQSSDILLKRLRSRIAPNLSEDDWKKFEQGKEVNGYIEYHDEYIEIHGTGSVSSSIDDEVFDYIEDKYGDNEDLLITLVNDFDKCDMYASHDYTMSREDYDISYKRLYEHGIRYCSKLIPSRKIV